MNSTKWWTTSSLILVLLVAGVSAAMAFGGHDMGKGMGRGDCQNSVEGDMPMNRKLEKMTRVFGLSDDQQAKIGEIMTSHHEQAEKRHENMQSVHAVMAEQKGAAFDENEVRKAAKLSVAAHEDMMVSRAKMQNEIYSVLTVEQRELSEKLEMMARDEGECGRRGSMHGGGMMTADAPPCR